MPRPVRSACDRGCRIRYFRAGRSKHDRFAPRGPRPDRRGDRGVARDDLEGARRAGGCLGHDSRAGRGAAGAPRLHASERQAAGTVRRARLPRAREQLVDGDGGSCAGAPWASSWTSPTSRGQTARSCSRVASRSRSRTERRAPSSRCARSGTGCHEALQARPFDKLREPRRAPGSTLRQAQGADAAPKVGPRACRGVEPGGRVVDVHAAVSERGRMPLLVDRGERRLADRAPRPPPRPTQCAHRLP